MVPLRLLLTLTVFFFLANPTTSQRFMTSRTRSLTLDHNYLYYGLPATGAFSSLNYNLPLSEIHTASTRYEMVLSGYKYSTVQIHCFGYTGTGWSSGMVSITMIVCMGTALSYIKVYLMAINPNDYLWVTFETFMPQTINSTFS
jgi:hypothetical protein